MPADSGKLAEKAQELVQWILDQALDGIGPLPSASDLADDYKSQPYANDAERVQALIRWAVAKNAGTGFVTGLGGVLTLPVTIPGSLAASLAIQAPMVAAIAEIYGHDSKDDRVRTAVLLCTIGTAMEDVAKQSSVSGLPSKIQFFGLYFEHEYGISLQGNLVGHWLMRPSLRQPLRGSADAGGDAG